MATPPHSLRCRHDVPAAALIHPYPLLGLLAEIHRLLATFDQRAKEVRCQRPVSMGVASVPVVTAVVALTMEIQESNS